jgi:hypothetical protein
MKTRHIILSILLISLVGFLKWTQLTMAKLERDVEMAKLALMGEFTFDSLTPGGLTSGDRYTVVKVEEFSRGEGQKLLLSEKTTKWLRENPHRDGFKVGFPIGTVPKPLPHHPNDVEFDVVVWKLEPIFSANGDVSYRAERHATRVVTPKDHPLALAQTPSAGVN